MQIIFRPMTLEDVAKVHEIETHSFKTAWLPDYFQKCIASVQHIKIIAEIEGKISAYAIMQFFNDRKFYLSKFVVAPEFRRHGLGKIFLEALLKFICNWGGGGSILTRQHEKHSCNSPVRKLRLQSFWADRKFLQQG